MSTVTGTPSAPGTTAAAASAALNTGTPPATTTAAPATTTTAAPAATTTTDWTTGLAEDARGYVQNKGFKTPGDVLESYRQLEKLHSVPQDRILKLPEDMNTPEGRAIRERLGAPKTAQEYGLDKLMPKEGGDAKLAEWASGVFHEIGVPLKDAEKIIGKWNERGAAAQKADQENYQAMLTQGEAALKKEWGAAYEQNINVAKQGVRALELKGEEVDALERLVGRERLFKTMQSIGSKVGEAAYVGGRPAADGVLAPEQARNRLTELYKDSTWVSRFTRGDADAKQQMQKLQQMAYPGEFTI